MKKYEKPEIKWLLVDEDITMDIVGVSGGDEVASDSFDVTNPPPFNKG